MHGIRRITIRGVVFAVAVAAALSLLVSGIKINRAFQTAKVRGEQLWRFSAVVLALRAYEDNCGGSLPKAVTCDATGTPCFSWRAELLRFTESIRRPPPTTKSRQPITEPWWKELPKDIASKRHADYCFSRNQDEPPACLDTHIWAVTGGDTAFDDDKQHSLAELPYDLIILIEVAHSDTHWMAPGDLDVNDVPESITEGTDGEGVVVAFADAEAWFLSHDVPIADLRKFFTIEGAKRYDREKVLGPYEHGAYHKHRVPVK